MTIEEQEPTLFEHLLDDPEFDMKKYRGLILYLDKGQSTSHDVSAFLPEGYTSSKRKRDPVIQDTMDLIDKYGVKEAAHIAALDDPELNDNNLTLGQTIDILSGSQSRHRP